MTSTGEVEINLLDSLMALSTQPITQAARFWINTEFPILSPVTNVVFDNLEDYLDQGRLPDFSPFEYLGKKFTQRNSSKITVPNFVTEAPIQGFRLEANSAIKFHRKWFTSAGYWAESTVNNH